MDPYIERILGILGSQEPILVLQNTPAKLEVLLEIFSPDDLESSYEAGKWTAREILCHLADVEMLIGYRIRQGISEDNHVLQNMEQDIWATRYKKMDAALAVETFRALRAWNLALFSSFGLEEWNREVTHPARGVESIDLMVRFLAGHDLNHLKQLEAISV